MSTAIKREADKDSSGVKVSKTTGGAYADMADVIESELGHLLDKHGVQKDERVKERARLRSAKLTYWRRRALASGK